MIVFDFCGVLGEKPSTAAKRLLQRRARRPQPDFWDDYWLHRPEYDLGILTDGEYWSRVASDAPDLEALVEADVTGWTCPQQDMLALVDDLPGRKAILSNAPTALARRIDAAPWAERFAVRVFSADIGVAKPDPRAYQVLCSATDTDPSDLLFIDDRVENVAAARAAGIPSLVFTDGAALRKALS